MMEKKMRARFDLIVFHQDVADVIAYATGLVLSSRCPDFSRAALLLEAAELAVLECKAQWPFTQNSEVSFNDLRSMAEAKAFELYHNGGDNYGEAS